MKTKSLLFAFTSIFCFTLSFTPKLDSEAEKSNVRKIVKELYQSFEQKDINLMSEIMAHDESMLSFGTGISDVHKSWKEWKENHMAQFDAIDEAKINGLSIISNKSLRNRISRLYEFRYEALTERILPNLLITIIFYPHNLVNISS